MLILSTPVLAALQIERALIEFVLNDVPRGEVLVVLEDGDIWLPVEALEAAGLGRVTGRRARFDAREFVSVASLEPDVKAVFDERALTIRLTASPALFPPTEMIIKSARPADIEYTRTPGAFVNYAAAWHPGSGTDLFGEGAFSIGPAVLSTQATWLAGGQHAVRGLTSLVVDDRRAMRRWTFGDLVVPGDALHSGVVAGGFSVAREYALDPYYEPYPSPAFSGMVTTPSTVEVYVNDQLVRRDALPPGPFDVRQLPVTTGLGNTRITVRDAYGRVEEFGAPYYLPSGILKRGTLEYRFTGGARRGSDTTRPADYGQLAALGASRVGLTNWLTLGVGFEGDRLTAGAGPTASLRVWRLGELEWASATSRQSGRIGRAESLSYAFIARTFSVSAVARLRSAAYATLAAPPPGRNTSEVAGSVSFPLGPRGSISMQHAAADVADASRGAFVRTTGTTITTTWRVGSHVDLRATALWSSEDGNARRLTASSGLTVLLGTRTAAAISHERAEGRTPVTVVEAQQSVTAGPGFGYAVRGETGDARLAHGRVEYQSALGGYELIGDAGPGAPGSLVSASGAVVAVGRRLHLTRAIAGSYALVQVPGAPAVRVFANNQEVGRTDRHGDLIVPNLLPYYGNRLRIADEDVPIDREIERAASTVAPPFRGAALARFISPQRRAVWGTLALVGDDGGVAVPAYGEITVSVAGQARVSPVGADGEFYFEDLPSSVYAAIVAHRGRTYVCPFQVPELAGPLLDLGRVECRSGVTGDAP